MWLKKIRDQRAKKKKTMEKKQKRRQTERKEGKEAEKLAQVMRLVKGSIKQL